MEILQWTVLLAAVALNVAILLYGLRLRAQLASLRSSVRSLLRQALSDLDKVETMALTFHIQVQDTVPVQTEIPVKEKMDVAVKGNIPIKQMIETEVVLKSPFFGAKVPVEVTVPIEMNVPVDLDIPVLIDYNVPVKIDVPINLDVPVHIELGKTEFGDFIRQVRGGLVELDGLLKKAGNSVLPSPPR